MKKKKRKKNEKEKEKRKKKRKRNKLTPPLEKIIILRTSSVFTLPS
jgi:hypothetical protein